MDNLLNSIYLRSDTTDIKVFMQIFRNLEYEIDFKLNPKVIVDCGANTGLSTIYFKNKYPDATIIAIEPESSNFDLLLKNTKGYSNLHCLKKGIWNRDVNLEIANPEAEKWAFITKEVEYESNNTIEAISIDRILEEYDIETIDILKIDIEGSEKELFEKNFENWIPRTKIILIELHDFMRNGCSKSFIKALENFSFSVSKKGENFICYQDSN